MQVLKYLCPYEQNLCGKELKISLNKENACKNAIYFLAKPLNHNIKQVLILHKSQLSTIESLQILIYINTVIINQRICQRM